MTSIWLSFGTDANPYQASVMLGQFLIIPGFFVLFSRIMYGPHNWGRRIRATLAVVLSGFMLASLIIAVLEILDHVAAYSTVLPIGLFLIWTCGMIAGLLFINRKARRRSVELEAMRWLAERQSGARARECRWRNRGIRWASWIPLTTVLMVLLFFPEVSGIVSYLRHREASQLPGYRVPIPLTWIAVFVDKQRSGQSHISGLAGRGMVFGVTRYLHSNPPLSGWRIWTDPYDQGEAQPNPRWKPKDEDVIGRRSFTIGNEILACLECRSPYLPRPHFGAPPLVFISCYSSGRFGADFGGEKIHVPAFYRMLEGTTQIK